MLLIGHETHPKLLIEELYLETPKIIWTEQIYYI